MRWCGPCQRLIRFFNHSYTALLGRRDSVLQTRWRIGITAREKFALLVRCLQFDRAFHDENKSLRNPSYRVAWCAQMCRVSVEDDSAVASFGYCRDYACVVFL